MTPQATHAIKAAQNRHNWGRWATRQYCQKHKVPFGAYRLACQLEVMKHEG